MRGDNILGDNIRAILHQKGWSQELLADKADISVNTIYNTIGDRHSPSVGNIYKIAQALSIPVWILFVEDGSAIPNILKDILQWQLTEQS